MSRSIPELSGDSHAKLSIISLLPNLLAVSLILAAILFVSAGRLDWFQAWLFVLAFSGFLTFYGLWGMRNDPGQLNEHSRVWQNTNNLSNLII